MDHSEHNTDYVAEYYFNLKTTLTVNLVLSIAVTP